MDSNYEITSDFRELYCPHLHHHYFLAKGHEDFERTVILPSAENDLYDASFPPALNHVLRRTRRPALVAFATTGGFLFTSPNGYQYFDPTQNVYFPAASYRCYGRNIMGYRRQGLRGTIVLVQDRGDGANFAHFTFDWLTRVLLTLDPASLLPILENGGTLGKMGNPP
jgi:hypothetical protein